ncbi:hypothetical protein [Paraburkholderia rhizosphaerae]|uniref:Putative carbohydrate-binding protein with CBM48 n=1 Tax=Paraburkholderia rhizosphaerae TaxID=480658 RepID=A0A4R8M510_9BURK|nr:hypothetical protein [Paraburkholderia rhizosphaerae]TDY54902.1 putative carbohydrate-binding protein with CBM48 [Paraburkholderia rhizosphaerae]
MSAGFEDLPASGYRNSAASRFPPGATVVPERVNFSIFCRHATHAELLLYAAPDSREPFQVITLSPEHNRTFFYWHVLAEDLPPHTCYTRRMGGPRDTQFTGRTFDPANELLDPYTRAVATDLWLRRPADDRTRARHTTNRAIVTNPLPAFAMRPWRDLNDAVIYELHVGGFTRDRSSADAAGGASSIRRSIVRATSPRPENGLRSSMTKVTWMRAAWWSSKKTKARHQRAV